MTIVKDSVNTQVKTETSRESAENRHAKMSKLGCCDHVVKKKHSNPFSVEYILSCDSSKKTQSRNVPQVAAIKQPKSTIPYGYVNKAYSPKPFNPPPVNPTSSEMDTIGMSFSLYYFIFYTVHFQGTL